MWVTVGNRSFDTWDVLTYSKNKSQIPPCDEIVVALATTFSVEIYTIPFRAQVAQEDAFKALNEVMRRQAKQREWERLMETPPPKDMGDEKDEDTNKDDSGSSPNED